MYNLAVHLKHCRSTILKKCVYIKKVYIKNNHFLAFLFIITYIYVYIYMNIYIYTYIFLNSVGWGA